MPRQTPSLSFEAVPGAEPWQVFRAEASFPLAPAERARVIAFVRSLAAALRHTRELDASLWLDTAELHRDGGSRIFSSHARAWSPTMGFALDPTGPAPRTLQFSDLADAPFGTPPKIFDRSAIFVSALAATASAYELMAGRGLANLLFFREDSASNGPGKEPHGSGIAGAVSRFMQQTRKTLEPTVASATFQHHPFYLPLLSARGVAGASAQQLDDWLGGAEVLLRENYEAGELLLLSRVDLAPALEAAGVLSLLQDRGKVFGWTLAEPEPTRSPQ